MANEIKAEFEAYVKQLAETISKEIYLKDLEELCKQYMEQLENCESLYKTHTEQETQVLEQTQNTIGRMDSLKESLSERLGTIDSELKKFQDECEVILGTYSTQVTEVNEEIKKDFMQELSGTVDVAKEELVTELTALNDSLKETLQETITVENLQDYIEQMEKSTAKISEGLALIHNGYEDVFKQYTAEMLEHGTEEWSKFQAAVEKQVDLALENVADKFDYMLEEQGKMVEQKLPDKQSLDQMCEQVTDMCAKIETMQNGYEKKLNRLVKLLERQEKIRLRSEAENRWQRKYIYLLTGSNVISILMLLLLIFAVKPWNADVLGVGGTTVFVMLAVIFILACIAGKYKNKKNNSTENKHQ